MAVIQASTLWHHEECGWERTHLCCEPGMGGVSSGRWVSQASFPEEVNLSWTLELCLFLFVHLFFWQTTFNPWYSLKALWTPAVTESSIHQPDIYLVPVKYNKCHRRHSGKKIFLKVQGPGFNLLLVQLRVNHGLNNSLESLSRLIKTKYDRSH